MRPHGKTKLGFYPLPLPEAERLRNCLVFPPAFSALDPCVGDGAAAFTHLLNGTQAHRYGVEIDAYRTEQARTQGIETLQANTLDVRCPAEAFSLLYLNPPYDLEIGATNNQRLELVFLEHTYRWLKPGGVLVFVIPQPQLRPCARTLSEHFTDLFVYKLTEPASVQYKQVAFLGVRRKRHQYLRDSALLESVRWLEMLATKSDLDALGEASALRYEIPHSGPAMLTNAGIPLDEVEDLLSAMARELVQRNGIGESADAVWKALHTEHQKLFPATSPSNEVVASLEAPGGLLTTQSDSASLIEEAIEGGSVLIFGQRRGSLSGRRPRGKPAVPEQASLFG